LGLDREIGQRNFGAFGVFLAELSASILVQAVSPLSLVHFFHYSTIISTKKPSLYIWNWDLNLGRKELGI
jgi:hypothetical protein